MKRILVIGGSGHFGARICRRILHENGVFLLISSRNCASAQRLVDELQPIYPAAQQAAVGLDQDSPDFEHDFRALRPDIVIHTAGPYQGRNYRVAEACIESASHYIDLADGRDFVYGFRRLHQRAQASGVLLVTGASTLPGLSSVVIDAHRDSFRRLDSVRISIAPAHQTPRGTGTIAAVLSYCGQPFEVRVDGRWCRRYGWQDMRVQRYPELGKRWSAACDVPDLQLLPEYLPGLKTASFHAALEAKWEQLALWLMAGLSRLGVVRGWSRLVPLFHRVSEALIGFGSDRGGMQIEMRGQGSSGNAKCVRWNLLAENNHGPEIPCTPALILSRKLIAGELALRGAYPCLGLFSMSDFAREVEHLDIRWNTDDGEQS